MKSLISSILGRCGSFTGRDRANASGASSRSALFEQLEPRALLATFTVANLNDAGAGSLRQAILDANGAAGADVVEFDSAVTGTITLTTGELGVSESLTINGPGASVLSVSGGNASRVFAFSAGTSTLSGLTITGGNAFNGGGITNAGTLTVSSAVISGNTVTTGGGAGIVNDGTMTLTDSTVAGNDSGIGDGGGIRNAGTMSVSNSTISGNLAVNGGAIANFGISLTVESSTISGNSASLSGAAIINFNIASFTNSTISENTAGSSIASSGVLTLVSTILAGTAGNDMAGTFSAGSTNNLIQDSGNSGGLTDGVDGNIIGVDPLLGTLAQNGGPTQTLALLTGSPAINQGANPNSLANDQRGFARVRGNGIDIGAFEFRAGPTIGTLVPSALSIARGQSVTLVASPVVDPDGTVARVDFYYDADNDNIPDTDELIGTDTDPTGGYGVVFDTTGLPAGEAEFMAFATDNDDGRGAIARTSVMVTNVAPTVGSLTPSVASAARGSPLTLTANTVADVDGTIARVDFYSDANNNSIADTGELVGSDSDAAGGYTATFNVPTTLAVGAASFLAIAVDNDGGASAISSAAVTVTNVIPTIASLTPSPATITAGRSVTLTANTVGDTDGTVARVDFFRDANANGAADTGELIGTDADSTGGFTFAFDSTGLAVGSAQFLAVAVDNDGGSGVVSTALVAVVHPFGSAAGQLLGGSSGSSGNLNVTTRNGEGTPIVLQQQGGQSTWTGSDLQAKSGSPQVTGEVVTWVDSKDGLNYAAAMTVSGLVLFTNTAGSNWTFRNLSTEASDTHTITGNLTVFTSTDNLVNLAGTDAAGDLIRWQQTGASTGGNFAWAVGNLADDLRAQSLTVPQFAGRITSFVTPWNALNVVGLDAAGQIQAVWWHQSLQTDGKWTTNNLSAEYGAPPLTGGLTVWLTSWSAINIAGTDTNGKLSATWWVPNFNNNQWQTNNLTDEFDGPNLQADSMTSWVTSWGAMNIAGREADGTTSVYWWVPNYNNNQWQVAKFSEILPSATLTAGPVTGITAPGGDFSMSILSTSAAGDVIRYWWSPTSNIWAEQNLTQTAVPA